MVLRMGLKGVKRQVRAVAVGAASFGMLIAGVVFTAPSAVAQDTATWTMPTLRGTGLQTAVDSVLETAGPDNVTFNIYDAVNNQVVYNYPSWVVCGQSPGPEATVKIGAKPQRVTLALKRRLAGC
jgi:hypothetical protein